MLEEQQHVFDAALEAEVNQLSLEAKAFVVGDATEIEVLDHACPNCSEAGMTGQRAVWKVLF